MGRVFTFIYDLAAKLRINLCNWVAMMLLKIKIPRNDESIIKSRYSYHYLW